MTRYILPALALLASIPNFGDVRLPKIVGSNMVIQRESAVQIWGWADPGEAVRVTGSWDNSAKSVHAGSDGHWSVSLNTGPAGGPYEIKIEGKNSIKLENVLFGEVWLASGQSNMEMPFIRVSGAYTGIKDSATEVTQADFPEIRLFQAGNYSSNKPLDDVQSGITMYGIPPAKCAWQVCSPESVPTFSSTAYFFARALHQELDVPIGIIDSSWGGTPAEAWTPVAGLQELGYTAEVAQARDLPQKPDQKIPSRLYNGMIYPVRNFRIKGAIWYQGEGNAGRADRYEKLFSTMIGEWRKAFGYDFPFYYVQIAPFKYRGVNAAFLREAQLRTLAVSKTGMAVTMDIGNLTDIHPKNKQEVGRRLALWALAHDYKKDVVYSGPTYKGSVIRNGSVAITFEHLGGGLTTNDGDPPSHFEIAGDDQVFHAATAIIKGEEVIVSSDRVSEPKAVRYAFTSDAMPNLMNTAGLPASSFRTDSWK